MSRALSSRRYLGIDIGGSSAKCAVISGDGEILSRESFATGLSVSRDQFLSDLERVVCCAANRRIDGVGLCSLGFVDSRSGDILGGVENMPCLEGMNLPAVIARLRPGLPVRTQNDVNAAALGEMWLGAARGCGSFACFALGTGLGGAIVLDGKLVEGAHFRAGEACYMDYRGDDDCLETYTSTKRVMEQAAKKLQKESIDGFEFFGLVRRENRVCLAILEEWIGHIARFVANAVVLLDLEKVIIGGGISQEKEILIPRLSAAVARRQPPGFRGQAEILAAQCAGDAAVLGSVAALAQAERNGDR